MNITGYEIRAYCTLVHKLAKFKNIILNSSDKYTRFLTQRTHHQGIEIIS